MVLLQVTALLLLVNAGHGYKLFNLARSPEVDGVDQRGNDATKLLAVDGNILDNRVAVTSSAGSLAHWAITLKKPAYIKNIKIYTPVAKQDTLKGAKVYVETELIATLDASVGKTVHEVEVNRRGRFLVKIVAKDNSVELNLGEVEIYGYWDCVQENIDFPGQSSRKDNIATYAACVELCAGNCKGVTYVPSLKHCHLKTMKFNFIRDSNGGDKRRFINKNTFCISQNIDCANDKDCLNEKTFGADYRGDVDESVTGKKCLAWSEKDVAKGIGQWHNYCRNLNPINDTVPGCKTTAGWEDCDFTGTKKCTEKGITDLGTNKGPSCESHKIAALTEAECMDDTLMQGYGTWNSTLTWAQHPRGCFEFTAEKAIKGQRYFNRADGKANTESKLLCKDSPKIVQCANYNYYTSDAKCMCDMPNGKVSTTGDKCECNLGLVISSDGKRCEAAPGAWSKWTDYTPATCPCGGGKQKRTRTCMKAPCKGRSKQSKTCTNTTPCPVDFRLPVRNTINCRPCRMRFGARSPRLNKDLDKVEVCKLDEKGEMTTTCRNATAREHKRRNYELEWKNETPYDGGQYQIRAKIGDLEWVSEPINVKVFE